jgi:hypothetical protein
MGVPGRGRQPAVGCGWPDSQLMSRSGHAVTSHDRRAAAPAWCVGERRTSHPSEFPPERATVARQRVPSVGGRVPVPIFSRTPTPLA